ncbi:MAG: 16S rRNA (guanine(966)-N(2))-methyltransferase RsmD [Spirochaetales bacterium]
MRITGGTLVGQRVKVPPGEIRPAMDRMRESLFSILGPLDGTSFLDLFAGSGIMALEAISRGAWPVTLVEKDQKKRATILANLEIAPSAPRLVIAPVEVFVKRERSSFDLIYLDPPFPYRYKADLLLRIARSRLIREGTKMLIHYPTQEALPDSVESFSVRDERNYGGSQTRLYESV